MFGIQPTSRTVFHVHTNTLLLRVTALSLGVIAPITACNSPNPPSLKPPRLGPTARSRTTEYPQWSSTILTLSNPTSFITLKLYSDRILAGLSMRPPPVSASFRDTRRTSSLLLCVYILYAPESSFLLNHPLRHASSRYERRPDTERM